MATMDIFEGDAFSIIELTRALENIPFKPAILSGGGLFGSRGVRQRTVMIGGLGNGLLNDTWEWDALNV